MKYSLSIILFLIVLTTTQAQQKSFIPVSNNDGWEVSETLNNIRSFQMLDSLLKAGKWGQITSLVVAKDHKIIFEGYYNDASISSKHNTRSATKTITSVLIGCLIDDQLIKSEKEEALQFFDFKSTRNWDARKSQIIIEDLLTMSSMLECDDWNQFSRGNEERMYIVEDWIKFYWDLPIKGFPAWTEKPDEAKYGRSFSYCTAGAVVLGGIIEKASRSSLEKYAEERLFSALGIKDYDWQYIPTGIPMTGGGLALRSRDLLKIAQLYQNMGKWKNERLVSQNWIEKSTSAKTEINEGVEYGYLWWLEKFGGEAAYYMTGTGGNKVVIIPDLGLSVVITSTNFGLGMKAHQHTSTILNDYVVPQVKGLK